LIATDRSETENSGALPPSWGSSIRSDMRAPLLPCVCLPATLERRPTKAKQELPP
jgi:hypothetical protein